MKKFNDLGGQMSVEGYLADIRELLFIFVLHTVYEMKFEADKHFTKFVQERMKNAEEV